MLVQYGSTPVNRIAQALCADDSRVREWVAFLIRSGVVEKRSYGAPYPALNRGHRLHHVVRALLLALSRRFPQPEPRACKRRLGFSTNASPKPPIGDEIEWMFGPRNHSRVLMLVGATGTSNLAEIAAGLQRNVLCVQYAVDRLVDEKLLAEFRDGRHRMLRINPKMPCAREFVRLLKCIARYRKDVRSTASSVRLENGYRFDRDPMRSTPASGRTTRFRGHAIRRATP